MILICLCALQVALALPADDGLNLPSQTGNDTRQGLVCLPFGVCEPCPDEAVSCFCIEPVILNIFIRSCKPPFANHLVTGVSCTALTQPPLYHRLMNRRLRIHLHLHNFLRPIIRHYRIPKAKFPRGNRAAVSSTKSAQTFTNLLLAIFYSLSLLCLCCSRGRNGWMHYKRGSWLLG